MHGLFSSNAEGKELKETIAKIMKNILQLLLTKTHCKEDCAGNCTRFNN